MGFINAFKAGYKKSAEESKIRMEKEKAEKEERKKCLAEFNRRLDLNDAARADKTYQKLEKKSVELHEKIEEAYAVLRNLDDYQSANADKFISMCEKYFDMTTELKPYREKYEYMPLYADPYKRLAMVYEKREDYYNAAMICVRSINDGLPNDGPKSSMRNRLSRMIKKGKLEPTDEMKIILSETFE